MTVSQVRLSRLLKQRRGEQIIPSTTYSIAGVFGFGKGLILREAISGSETKYKSLTPLKAGDVVYSKVKAFEGAITVVPAAGHGRFVSPEFPVFGVSDSVNADYLRHLFAWEGFVDQLRGKSSGIGARRERGIRIPLPDLAEQRQAAEHLEKIRERTDAAASSRADGWKPVESMLALLSWDTPLHALLGEDLDEVELESNKQYRQLGVFGKSRGIIDRGTFFAAETKYTKMLRVRAGQVVLSRLKAFEGAVAIADKRHDGGLVSKEFPTFTVLDGVDPHFVRAVLSSSSFEERLRARSVGLGARRERVDAQRFMSIEVPLPPLDVQRNVGRAAECASRIRALQQRSDLLGDALLPAARNEVFSSLR